LTQQIDIDVKINVDVTVYVHMTTDVKMAHHVIFDNLDFKQDMKFDNHNLKFTCVWHGKIRWTHSIIKGLNPNPMDFAHCNRNPFC
jgi:hypothetical protein